MNGEPLGAAALAVAVLNTLGGAALALGARGFQTWALRQPLARKWNPLYPWMRTRGYRIELRCLGACMLAMGLLVLVGARR